MMFHIQIRSLYIFCCQKTTQPFVATITEQHRHFGPILQVYTCGWLCLSRRNKETFIWCGSRSQSNNTPLFEFLPWSAVVTIKYWKFAAYIKTLPPQRWLRRCIDWTPPNNRQCGGPPFAWDEKVRAFFPLETTR